MDWGDDWQFRPARSPAVYFKPADQKNLGRWCSTAVDLRARARLGAGLSGCGQSPGRKSSLVERERVGQWRRLGRGVGMVAGDGPAAAGISGQSNRVIAIN